MFPSWTPHIDTFARAFRQCSYTEAHRFGSHGSAADPEDRPTHSSVDMWGCGDTRFLGVYMCLLIHVVLISWTPNTCGWFRCLRIHLLLTHLASLKTWSQKRSTFRSPCYLDSQIQPSSAKPSTILAHIEHLRRWAVAFWTWGNRTWRFYERPKYWATSFLIC